MALPSIEIGESVNYFPSWFDADAMPDGEQVRTAAIVTAINTADQTVDLIVFPRLVQPVIKAAVKYFSDVSSPEGFFLLISDSGPACTDEKTGPTVTDTQQSNFTITWGNPAGYYGTAVMYRVLGDPDWLQPNIGSNATGDFTDLAEFTFTAGLVSGTTYEILIQNICPTGLHSAGVTTSALASPDL